MAKRAETIGELVDLWPRKRGWRADDNLPEANASSKSRRDIRRDQLPRARPSAHGRLDDGERGVQAQDRWLDVVAGVRPRSVA